MRRLLVFVSARYGVSVLAAVQMNTGLNWAVGASDLQSYHSDTSHYNLHMSC